jgi:hypothetical protein
MYKFLDTCDEQKLNQENINHPNTSIISNEIVTGIKSLPTKKIPGPDEFTAEFDQTIREELIPTLLKTSIK